MMTNWQTKKIGDILTIRHGRNQKEVENSEGVYPILGTGGQIGRTNSYLYDKPSVLIGRKGTIDKPRYMDTPFWTVDTLFYSEIHNNTVPKFAFYIFNTINWYRYNEASGVPSLSASSISNIKVNVPEKPAQERIVSVLEVWDEYLEKLEQKIALKEELKKGLMQQLLTGARRLSGFSTSWASVKASQVAAVTAGGTPSTKRLEFWNGGNIPWMKSGEINKIYINETYHNITDLGLASSSAKIIPENSILVALAGQGSTRGKVAINKVPLSTNQSIAAFIPNKHISYEYLFWNLRMRYDELRSLSTGDGGRGGLNLFILKNLKIPLPSIDEQREIVKTLRNIDNEQVFLNAKRVQYQQQKKYLLKNLITGTIRTPETLTRKEIA